MKVKELLAALKGLDPEMFIEIPFDTEGLGGVSEPTWVGLDTTFRPASLVITNGTGRVQPEEIDEVLWSLHK